MQPGLFQQNLQNKSVGHVETFLQIFLVNHVKQFAVRTFCSGFWKPWREFPVVDDVLSSHKQEIYPATSLDENCIEFEFQTHRNHYVDLRQTYLVLKLKLVNIIGTKLKKENKL